MGLFKRIFGGGTDDVTNEEKKSESSPFLPEEQLPTDELFTTNFRKNGGKFLYCDSLAEVHEQFLNILEENDWFECEALCYNEKLYSLLEENKLLYNSPKNPKFLLAGCENLIANEGSILLSSKQIKQNKPNELPENIVIFATTSQIVKAKSDGLRFIKQKYDKEYPSNITTIKYFEKAKVEDFLQYGTDPKNLYLLLLEDL